MIVSQQQPQQISHIMACMMRECWQDASAAVTDMAAACVQGI